MGNAKYRAHCQHLEEQMKSVWFERAGWSIDRLIDLLEYRYGFSERKDRKEVLARLEAARKARWDLYNATHPLISQPDKAPENG